MTNKRSLKKTINYICSDLFSECMAASYNTVDKKDEIKAIITSILIVHHKYICRISHPEPGMPPKKYYNDLKEKLNIQIGEIIDQINNL